MRCSSDGWAHEPKLWFPLSCISQWSLLSQMGDGPAPTCPGLGEAWTNSTPLHLAPCSLHCLQDIWPSHGAPPWSCWKVLVAGSSLGMWSTVLWASGSPVRMASSFATTCCTLSRLKHIGGLNFRTFLPGPSVLSRM